MRILLLALFLLPRSEAAAPLHLKWADLPAAVVGRQVSIATADGVVRGKAVSVETDALVVQAKGKAVRVARDRLRRFEMETKAVKYRVIGSSLGFVAGFAGGAGSAILIQGGIFDNDNPKGAVAALIGITTLGTVAGYLVGNSGDKHWTPVEILD